MKNIFSLDVSQPPNTFKKYVDSIYKLNMILS